MSFIIQTSGVSAPGTQVSAVASGALAAGDIVIANSDGTVSAVTANAGSVVTSSVSTSPGQQAICYDITNAKTVCFGGTNNTTISSYVVTTTGLSVSLGTPVTADSGQNVAYMVCAYDANAQKVVVAYANLNVGAGAYYGVCRVGTVSGTSISFGSMVVFESSGINGAPLSICYDATAQKILIVYYSATGNYYAVVGTVSGTSISFGTKLNLVTAGLAAFTDIALAYDANAGKNVLFYKTLTGFSYRAAVLTISGTSVTAGSPVTVETDTSGGNLLSAAVYDSSAQKIVFVYRLNSTPIVRGVVGTVSGTSISFGTIVSSTVTSFDTATYDPNANKTAIFYFSGSNTCMLRATVTGTSITFDAGTSVIANSQFDSYQGCSAYDASQQKVILIGRNGSAQKVLATNPSFLELTSENFIGFSSDAYSSGATATMNCIGTIQDTFVGLTPGQAYYCLQNNTISQTPGSPSVFAGTCFATDKIIVKG